MALPTTNTNNDSNSEKLLKLIDEQEKLIEEQEREIQALHQELERLKQQEKTIKLSDDEIERKWDIYVYEQYIKEPLKLLYEFAGTHDFQVIIKYLMFYELEKRRSVYWENFPNKVQELIQEEKGLFKAKRKIIDGEAYASLLKDYKNNAPTKIIPNDRQWKASKELEKLPRKPNEIQLRLEKVKFKRDYPN